MKKFGFPLVIVAVIGVLVLIFRAGNAAKPAPSQKKDIPLLGTQYPELGRNHINPGAPHEEYNSNPPSSGSHYAQPANWGIKDQAEDDERYIHNLEHGGIWITYKPDLDPAKIERLKQIVSNLPLPDAQPDKAYNPTQAKFILSPRTKNDKAIALVSWGYVLTLDDVDEGQIKQFYEGHVDKAPELIP